MSLVIGAGSSSSSSANTCSSSSSSKSNMGLVDDKEGVGNDNNNSSSSEGVVVADCADKKMAASEGSGEGETGGKIERKVSESCIYPTTDDDEDNEVDDDEEEEDDALIQVGPQVSLKEQIEKDKDDESLRRWKEQLLGTVDMSSVGETLDPEVKILTLAIKSPGRPDIVLQIPELGKPKGLWFTLKEGSRYSLKFAFRVSNNIVCGLRYTNTVWKTGVKVDSAKEMLGTFSPQVETYTYEMPEETTPSGIFARGTYSARTKFVDDDNKCYLEINYTFDIRKDWQSS